MVSERILGTWRVLSDGKVLQSVVSVVMLGKERCKRERGRCSVILMSLALPIEPSIERKRSELGRFRYPLKEEDCNVRCSNEGGQDEILNLLPSCICILELIVRCLRERGSTLMSW